MPDKNSECHFKTAQFHVSCLLLGFSLKFLVTSKCMQMGEETECDDYLMYATIIYFKVILVFGEQKIKLQGNNLGIYWKFYHFVH